MEITIASVHVDVSCVGVGVGFGVLWFFLF
jgi:hypothetical protein